MPKYKSPFYNNQEEKKKFFNDNRHLLQELGYSENAIDELIAKQMKTEPVSEEAYERAMARLNYIRSTEKIVEDKYHFFHGNNVNSMVRFAQAMYLPETSFENVQYNEMIAKKLQTKKGTIEVLQEGFAALLQITPDIFKAAKEDPAVFMKYSQGFQMGFSVSAFLSSVQSLKDHPSSSEEAEALEKAFPTEIMNYADQNHGFYEGFVELRGEGLLYENKYHYLLPMDADLFSLAEYKKELSNIWLERNRNSKPAPAYAPLNDVCTAYIREVEATASVNRWDLVAAAKRPDRPEDRINILRHVSAFEASMPRINPGMSQKERAAATFNMRLMKKDVQNIVDKAIANYQKPFRESADEMASILSSGNMHFHFNQHYEDMISLMDSICKLSRKGEMRALKPEDKQKLSHKLHKLNDAATKYLNTKIQDTTEFSPKALQRITAARLCIAFTKGRIRDLALAKNADLKDQFLNAPFTKKDAQFAFSQAGAEYTYHPTLENFVKCLSYKRMVENLEKSGKESMSTEDKLTMLETDMKIYRLLYTEDETFMKAVHRGYFQQARNAIKPAVEALKQRQAQQHQENINPAAPKIDGPVK